MSSEHTSQQNTQTDELATLRAQCEEYLNGWKRATADYQNLKKDLENQRLEYAEYANVKALMEFFPIYDNLKKAALAVPEDQRELGWVQGVLYILRQFEEVLKQNGLEPISAEGAAFDPTHHEAVSEESLDSVPPGTVIREVASGYTVRGKVIVPAKVIVAKGNK